MAMVGLACTRHEAQSPESVEQHREPAATPHEQPTGDTSDLPGVDLSKLSQSQRSTLFQIIDTEPSACGKPHSLATSVREDAACRDSKIVAQFVVDALVSGATTHAIKEATPVITDSLKPREVPIGDSAVYGDASAPVTVVVFADFQCPHCREEASKLQDAIDRYHGRAKLVFKHFPLTGHPRSRPASRAVEAAHAQGKFWPMQNLLFQNQDALSDEDFLRYAEDIGLDIGRFKADVAAEIGDKQIEADRALGESLSLSGTPAVFVNGRFFNTWLFGGTVAGWIDEALKRR